MYRHTLNGLHYFSHCIYTMHSYTVEPLIKDTPNKGHHSIRDTCFDPMLILSCTLNKGHLCIKDSPSVSFIQRFHCTCMPLKVV